MDFPLFQAEFLVMDKLAFSKVNFEKGINTPEIGLCSFCQKERHFFWIECDEQGEVTSPWFIISESVNKDSLTKIAKSDELVNDDYYYRGCFDCLKQGKFVRWHYTEYGEALPDWTTGKFPASFKAPVMVAIEAVNELLRTPGYNSWQDDVWLLHCNDFMVYLGEWGQKQFHQKAADGNGEALFSQVIQANDFETKEWSELYERDSGFHLFQCKHCGVMRSCTISG